ncbi:unnamed protein product [Thlaspi arvense]|uniref:Uncharacterized protein n=1 Tax=Thlaspi arvense TaxID=13288 RepID=A0AAU9RBS0_THLAR|nr:unnamed protein product [Thlaspi arvense]
MNFSLSIDRWKLNTFMPSLMLKENGPQASVIASPTAKTVVSHAACGTAGALYALITAVTSCGCIYSCIYGGKMRAQYNIRGSDCGDCLKHVFCELCALTQQYRELKHRGFDMSLGWAGNVQRQQNQGVAMGAPVYQGGMTR